MERLVSELVKSEAAAAARMPAVGLAGAPPAGYDLPAGLRTLVAA